MARRKRLPAAVNIAEHMPTAVKRRLPDDPFLGQHFEDFLSPMDTKVDWPEQPMEAALNVNSPYQEPNDGWYVRMYGDEQGKRREFLEHDEPGGKTFNFRRGEFR